VAIHNAEIYPVQSIVKNSNRKFLLITDYYFLPIADLKKHKIYSVYRLSNCLTISEITLLSALPASSLEAIPITFPISLTEEAPVYVMMFCTTFFISAESKVHCEIAPAN